METEDTAKNCIFYFRVLYWTQTEEQKRGRPGNEAIFLPFKCYLEYTNCHYHIAMSCVLWDYERICVSKQPWEINLDDSTKKEVEGIDE